MTKTTPTRPDPTPTGAGFTSKLTKRPWLLALSIALLLTWFGFLISMAVR